MSDMKAFLKLAQQLNLPNIEEGPVRCAEPGCGFASKNADDFVVSVDDHKPYCKDHWHGALCHTCGEGFRVEDMVDFNGSYYCKPCAAEVCETCPNCNEVVDKEDILEPTRNNRHSMKHGGCDKCASKCTSCGRVVDNDEANSYNGDTYCEDCFGEKFTSCESCNEVVYMDDSHYVENEGSFCDSCYSDKYEKCHECHESYEKSDMHEDDDGYYFCESCWSHLSEGKLAPYKEETGLENFSFSKKDRFINQISKIVPISVKTLKVKYPALAAGLQELIVFTGGKDITMENLTAYKAQLPSQHFPLAYSTWDSSEQRSVKNYANSQLVINIIISPEMKARLNEHEGLYDLFTKINDVSKKSSHPYVEGQFGWARVELNKEEKYVLVDEIQTDHSNALKKIKGATYGDLLKIKTNWLRQHGLTEERGNEILNSYAEIIKEFPEVANQAITSFAIKNGYKKIFWHTYESGKNLKKNNPPRSIYEKTPKDHFFTPSEQKPFDLNGDFLERDAKDNAKVLKVARRLALKKLVNS